MGETSIEWTGTPMPDGTTHGGFTFSPWEGCTAVSPGCDNCYAETANARWHPNEKGRASHWGKRAPRLMRSEAYWRNPFKWNRLAEKLGVRLKVFCSSVSDVFEDRRDLDGPRARLFVDVISKTPHLDWLLLTKRPQNMLTLVPAWWRDPKFQGGWPSNVWAGTTCEDQRRADERIPYLLEVPARVRFLSCEPLLGPVDLKGWGTHAPSDDHANAPESWKDYVWPEWVPAEQRKQIEEFWSESWGRGPRSWLRDHIAQDVPATGARITCAVDKLGWATVNKTAHSGVTGRYLHSWNNIGRIVKDDGTVIPASGGIGSGWLSRWLTPAGDYQHKLHWVIAGGESGHGARPMQDGWVRGLRDQCARTGVSFFFKQKLEGRKVVSLPILDGRQHAAFPEVRS
ncbi:MAG: DUF5131 family protein [Polyangiaceae bacterium]|nr:DUF5131 family protein [Polyangiaceae bacterium]